MCCRTGTGVAHATCPAAGGVASGIMSPSSECEAALVLGLRPFASIGARDQDYQLVRARNLLAGTATCPGPGCWQLTYKQRQAIPTSNPPEHPIGAGGEILVVVDVAARAARVGGPLLPSQMEQMEASSAPVGEPFGTPTERSTASSVECGAALRVT
jgi:hypothetical protein